MCVRTITSNDFGEIKIQNIQPENKSSKVKDKFIKKYQDMLNKKELEGKKNQLKNHLSHFKCEINSYLSKYYKTWENSIAYKIVFTTTQPAHIITIVAVLYVISMIIPITDDKIQLSGPSHSKLMSFIYLTSFIIHFGSQIWMTFVSGLSLYFALPRHLFSQVQRVLFPRYFTINSCLSLITLVIFLKFHPIQTWDKEITIQVCGMSGAFFLELLIRLYLTPILLKLMILKNDIEKAAGIGQEIGHENFTSLKHCTHWIKINQAFRKTHTFIAIGNIFTMICTLLHLYYISSKIYIL